jgi:hypothetical protein
MKTIGIRLTIISISFILISLILAGQSSAKIDPKSVMGMWLFDQKGDVGKDASQNGNDGNIEGKPEWIDKGKFNGGLYFDNTDDQDVIKVDMAIDYDEITVMVWFKDQGSPVRPRLVSNEHTDVSLTGFQLEYDMSGATNSFFDVGTGARGAAIFSLKAKQDTWYHYAGTYDGSKVRAYIDGESMGEGSTSGAIKKTSFPVHIGVSTYAQSDGFKGVLDEVAIFNKALSQDDIKDIMKKGLEMATGLTAVSPSGKLASAWGEIKSHE